MKLYKFYKNDCAPCYSLERLLTKVGLPEGTELVSLNVADKDNLEKFRSYGFKRVPALAFENGDVMEGSKTEEELVKFLNQ